ncbi:RlpA-like double-psi beta-barrel-protein domain-containing protein-containing protein [Rhodocollybia butyracea]|uniref:RlpA-like double-psi beta-barrel-protein domain-containing protein-containing protein n=1 Tax=Rhodocollybia butyracea TaxID=206335 RepID=A0A9P5PNU3_9AGAR|nr:RlpA-like double-psi beta-barrel-protein domain-containing protein-containing protein [Rhodocollybia butyracea]
METNLGKFPIILCSCFQRVVNLLPFNQLALGDPKFCYNRPLSSTRRSAAHSLYTTPKPPLELSTKLLEMPILSCRILLWLILSLCSLNLTSASHDKDSVLHLRHISNAKRESANFRRSTSLEKRFDDARFTFFADGLGACGITNSPSDFIVALNSAQYGNGEFCFQMITITVGSQTTQAQITDECPGCPFGGLDFSEGLFQFFSPLSVGVLTGSWDFVSASATSTTPTSTFTPTSTSTPPPPPPSTTSTQVSTSSSSSSSLSSSTFSTSTTSTASSTPTPTVNSGVFGLAEEAVIQMAGLAIAASK